MNATAVLEVKPNFRGAHAAVRNAGIELSMAEPIKFPGGNNHRRPQLVLWVGRGKDSSDLRLVRELPEIRVRHPLVHTGSSNP